MENPVHRAKSNFWRTQEQEVQEDIWMENTGEKTRRTYVRRTQGRELGEPMDGVHRGGNQENLWTKGHRCWRSRRTYGETAQGTERNRGYKDKGHTVESSGALLEQELFNGTGDMGEEG